MPTHSDNPANGGSEQESDQIIQPQSAPVERSGGTDITAAEVNVGADVVGRDKIVQNIYNYYGPANADQAGQTDRTETQVKRIFISYKRNTQIDEPLALQLHHVLQEHGHEPFIDQAMQIGVDWAKEIQRQVENADFFIILLSDHSVHSEMVTSEVDFAYRHFVVHGHPTILPIRLNYTDPLPYQLSNYLDRLQYAKWQGEADTGKLISALLKAVEGAEALPAIELAPRATTENVEIADDGHALFSKSTRAAPLPGFDPRLILEAPTGAVRIKSQFYIEREVENDLRRQIIGDGTTTTIRAPRQMGKTSLLVRGVQDARKIGQQVVYIDFQRVNESYFASLDGLLRYVADEFASRLGLDPALVDKVWASSRGAQDKLNVFLERHVLTSVETPLLLAMDEADRLLGMPYKSDFFGLLRAWDSNRAYDELWQQLNIAIVISTHPHLLITDVSQSPFNVGLRIQLTDFDAAQVSELNRRHNSPLQPSELESCYELLGGHPYLTRQALYTLVDQELSWDAFARLAPDDDGPFGSHLRTYLWQLSEREELVKGMLEVLLRGRCSDETVQYRLNAAGLVKEEGDRVKARCDLYAQYFGAKLR